jgi:hypothetical protein
MALLYFYAPYPIYLFTYERLLMSLIQALNTKGAAKRLGCSETWIHKLVTAGKIKAYAYDTNGVLAEHKPEGKRRGQGLYFLSSDIDAYQLSLQRRPRGSKKQPENT